jgi:hypothetical protein
MGRGPRIRLFSGVFFTFVFAFLTAFCLYPVRVDAQALSIQGDRFAVDGTPRFLVFISYFGAMGAPNVNQDLRLLRNLGFDGVRIWPNLDTGPQLMNGDGTLRPTELARLRSILDAAKLERLVVDVTFTHEHIAGMTPATAKIGIMAATEALRSYDNLLFDIQNERNVGDRRFMSEADVASIYAGIKSVDPSRIATADNSLGEDWGPQYASDFTARLGLDVNAFHERRASDWYTLPFYQRIVRTLKGAGKPVYLQEPNNTRDSHYAANDRAEYFMQAIANAKLAGAAAWCFHTLEGTDFRQGPPFLEDRLRAFPDVEWTFVNSLIPRIMLRASNGVNYLVPEGGGGGGVRADRTAAGPGSWPVLTAASVSGGPLVSGDRVAFATADGKHFLQAPGGGGATLMAGAESIGPSETFTIERRGDGVIRHGESVTLRVSGTSWYVSAEGGGGGNVQATAASPGRAETFTLLFVSPHSAITAAAAGEAPLQKQPAVRR